MYEGRVKKVRVDPGVNAVVSSGYSNDPVMAEYRMYGFKGVVSKPFDTEQLSIVLHDIINNQEWSALLWTWLFSFS